MTRFIARYEIFWMAALLVGTTACTPKLMIQSDPPQADVYISIEGRAERVRIGQTPFELSETQLMDQLKISPENSQWVEFTVEKKDHQNRTLLLPSNRWGELSRTMKLQLKPMDDTTTTVVKMVKYFFNAKKFAETKQFEQAHAEIDKILSIDSRMSQALNMKAGIYFLQGNIEEAKTTYRRALEADPGSNEAIQMLERIQNKAGAKP